MKSKWSTHKDLQNTAVHVILAPSQDPLQHSRIVWWRGHEEDHANHTGGLWGGHIDWAPNTDTTVTNWPEGNFTLYQDGGPSNRDIFCAAHHSLGDGSSKLFVAGGTSLNDFEVGVSQSMILDPATMIFDTTSVPNMTGQRWYGSATLLGDSRVVVASGSRYFHIPIFGGLRGTETNPSDRDVRVARMTTVPAPVPLMDFQVAPPNPADPNNQWPDAREGQSGGWTQSGALAYFGGRGATEYKNDVRYMFPEQVKTGDGYQVKWNNRTPTFISGGTPDGRADASFACVAQDRFVLFGGRDENGPINDGVWLWRPKLGTNNAYEWLALSPSGTPPSARAGHATAIDPDNARMYVLGGDGAGNMTVHRLQVTNASSYSPAPTAAWTQLNPSGTPPPWLTGGQMFFDKADRSIDGVKVNGNYTNTAKRLVVVGGRDANGNYPTKVWYLWLKEDGSCQWTDIDGPTVLGRERFAAVYDGGGRLYVYGGLIGASRTDGVGWVDVADGFIQTQRTWHELPALDAPTSGHLALLNQTIPFERRPEVYTAGASNPWTRLKPHQQEWYPFGFTIPDGIAPGTGTRVFYAGPGIESLWLNPSDTTNTWTIADTSVFGEEKFRGGSAVMYRIGRIMKCGTRDTENNSIAVATTGVIDLTQTSPVWVSTGAMQVGRVNHTVVLLPTGEVFVNGGTGKAVNAVDIDPRRTPEIWNPDTQLWRGGEGTATPLDASHHDRGYHSTAMLLPDGRILCGGGNATPVGDHVDDRKTFELFTPPYLFDATGALATRPRLLAWAKTAKLGQWVELRTDVPVDEIVLLRPGSVTHGFNAEQRYIPLTVANCSGVQPFIRIPADADSVPPGNYLIFALKAGVPAIGQWISISNTTFQTVPAQKTTLAIECPLANDMRLTWTAPQRYFSNAPCSGADYELRMRVGAVVETTATPTASTVITGPDPLLPGREESWSLTSMGQSFTAGTNYYFRIRTKRAGVAENLWSAWSPSLRITAVDPTNTECIPGTTGGSGGSGGYRAQRAFALEGTGQSGGLASNTVLGGAPLGESVRDLMRLPSPPIETAGRSIAWVSQQGGPATLVQDLRLLAVDHAADVEVVSSATGVHVGRRVPASAVVRISPDGTRAAFEPGAAIVVTTGDELVVTLASTSTGPLLLSGRGAYEPEGEAGGFVVEVPGGATGWTVLARHALRARTDAVCVPRGTSTELHVRVLTTTTFDALGTLEPQGSNVVIHELVADSLAHSTDGDATALFAQGAGGALLATGERLEGHFPTPPASNAEVRDWFLDVTGRHPGTPSAGGYARTLAPPTEMPLEFALSPGRPNPFRSEVELRLTLPQAGEVLVDVHDLLGRKVATLVQGQREAGVHSLRWDRRTSSGAIARSGIYMVRVRTAGQKSERKVVLLP